jgi:primosomal protein N' (replication factor Y)
MTVFEEKYYEILLPLPFNDGFSYKSCELSLKKGDIVMVSFGKRSLYGLVLKSFKKDEFLAQNKLDLAKIKEISAKNAFLHLKSDIIEFIEKIAAYNMAPKGLVLKAFMGFLNSDKVKDSLIEKSCFKQQINPQSFNLKPLSDGQDGVANKILAGLSGQKKVSLIDGVTGSGKTEIYFKVIAEILKNPNSQVLIMLPEIALTSQLLMRFEAVFGFKPALWHSKISKKEKRDIFYGIVNNDVKAIIGARSSLLLPFQNLRLIVVDEEHDSSYKQDEIFNFNARDMAILKAKIDNSNVILSSATPSLESYCNAVEEKKYEYYQLEEKFNKKTNTVHIIDLKREKLDKGDHISQKLRQELAKNFANKKQSLLFLNRRGYSPAMLCRACGDKVECPNCSVNLVYHKALKSSICHYCGHVEKFNKNCKKCAKEDGIISLGVGVEKLEEEVKSILPQAKIVVATSDNLTSFKDAQILVERIINNEIDIIIGTQMIAKGYDFPDLTLVGVVDVDSGFYSSDLKASEKSFQLLSQVFGRAGRKDHAGNVFVQTYNPDNLILKKLIQNDKNGFYKFELENRKITELPPFAKMAEITVSSLNKEAAMRLSKEIVKNAPFNEFVEVIGPAPAKLFRLRNRYYFNIYFKVNKKINLQKLIFDITNRLDNKNQANIKVDIDP